MNYGDELPLSSYTKVTKPPRNGVALGEYLAGEGVRTLGSASRSDYKTVENRDGDHPPGSSAK